MNEGNKYIDDSRLGTNYREAVELQNIQNQYEKEYHKVIYHFLDLTTVMQICLVLAKIILRKLYQFGKIWFPG